MEIPKNKYFFVKQVCGNYLLLIPFVIVKVTRCDFFVAKIPFSCSLFNVAVWLLNHLWKNKNIVIFNKGLIADEYLTKNHPIRNLKMHCGNNEKSMKDTVKILQSSFHWLIVRSAGHDLLLSFVRCYGSVAQVYYSFENCT